MKVWGTGALDSVLKDTPYSSMCFSLLSSTEPQTIRLMQVTQLSSALVSPSVYWRGCPSLFPQMQAALNDGCRGRRQEEISKGLVGPLYVQSMSSSFWSWARRWGWGLGSQREKCSCCNASPTAARRHTLHALPTSLAKQPPSSGYS